jgi:hypothetical protein
VIEFSSFSTDVTGSVDERNCDGAQVNASAWAAPLSAPRTEHAPFSPGFYRVRGQPAKARVGAGESQPADLFGAGDAGGEIDKPT